MSTTIASLTFCYLRRNDERGGLPELLVEQKSILRRPGTDGTSVRLEGKAGEPFRVRSMRDFETRTDALAELDSYKLLEETAELQSIVWDGVDWDATFGLKVAILKVSEPMLLPVRSVAGSMRITTTPLYVLYATWDLLPVDSEGT